jgi:hypothetical protein
MSIPIQQIAQQAAEHPQLHLVSVRSGVPLQRCAQLYAAAYDQLGDGDRSRRLVEELVNGRDALGAMRQFREGRRGMEGDGSILEIVLPCHITGRAAGLDGDPVPRVEAWTVDPHCTVRWSHQVDNPWRPAESTIGRVLADRSHATTGDLTVWVEITDRSVIERALYEPDLLSASPGVDRASPRTDNQHGPEQVRTWHHALVREISLTDRGTEALNGVTVRVVAAAPATPVGVPRARAQRDRTGYQHRTFPTAGLHVR